MLEPTLKGLVVKRKTPLVQWTVHKQTPNGGKRKTIFDTPELIVENKKFVMLKKAWRKADDASEASARDSMISQKQCIRKIAQKTMCESRRRDAQASAAKTVELFARIISPRSCAGRPHHEWGCFYS